jgi:hypothetical protein
MPQNANIAVGICGAVSLFHLLIFVRRREEKIHVGIHDPVLCHGHVVDIRMHTATTVDDFVRFYKTTNTIQAFLWVAFAWFIQLYSSNHRRWPVFLVSGLYALAAVLNLTFPHGILFEHIDDLNRVMLPWGEQIAFGVGPANPWRLLPGSGLVHRAGLRVGCIRVGLARQGSARACMFFSLSIFACLGIGYLHGTLIDLGTSFRRPASGCSPFWP